jgi:acetyl esterase/lipase
VGFHRHLTENLGCNVELNLDVLGTHDDILKNDEFFKAVEVFASTLSTKKPKRVFVKREKVVPEKAVIPMEEMVDIYLPVSTNEVQGDIVLIYIHGGYIHELNPPTVPGDVATSVKAWMSVKTSLIPPSCQP